MFCLICLFVPNRIMQASAADDVPAIPPQYVLTADRVVVDSVALADGDDNDPLFPQHVRPMGLCPGSKSGWFGTVVDRENIRSALQRRPTFKKNSAPNQHSATVVLAITDNAEALMRMSLHATTPDTVLAVSKSLCSVQFRNSSLLRAPFCTTSVVDAVVRMSAHATTPDAVRWLSAAICHLVTNADATVKAAL